MENSLKGLLVAAGVIITCLVISLGFYIAKIANQTGTDAISNLTNMKNQFLEGTLSAYDGTKIKGSQVVNAVSQLSSETLGLIVITKKDKQGTWYHYTLSGKGPFVLAGTSSAKENKMLLVMSDQYVNPSATFLCELLYDSNDVTIGIRFVQQ